MSTISLARPPGRLPVSGDLSSALVLALGAFAVGADAFVIAGFLPSIADALGVSTTDGGRSITAFLLTYAVLAPLLAVTTSHVPRRVLLVGALLVLGLANLLSALAPSLPVLMAGRMLAAVGAAAYTPIAAAVCAALVRPRSRAGSPGLVAGRIAFAMTLGLALGEFVSRWLGWRAALGTVSTVCLFAGVAMMLTAPALPDRPGARVRPPRSTLPSLAVLSVVAGYAVYAYGVPALDTIGVSDAAPVLTLFAYGLGAMVVNAVTGLRRAGEERRRIAQELHDSLTHNISLIKVQAGVAVHLARQRGEAVPERLLAIEEASAEAMRELRSTLHLLRDPDGRPTTGSLDGLPDLLTRVRAAGLPATMTVTGSRRTLPGEVDHAAYRIVQEALTNVSRHAGGASALVRIAYRPDRLTVRVDDDGVGGPPVSPGIGLTGMRERVTGLGGRLRAGPRPGGGFTVEADLPLPPASADARATARRRLT